MVSARPPAEASSQSAAQATISQPALSRLAPAARFAVQHALRLPHFPERLIMRRTTDLYVAEVHYEPDCPPEQVMHVLSALDRWSGRTARQVAHLRATDRHDYRTTVIIEPNKQAAAGEGLMRQVFHVPTRNVSKAGLGFLAPPVFMTQQPTDVAPLVRTDEIFQVGTAVKVMLGPSDAAMPTLKAVVTRLRPVHFGFFDVGIRFTAREEA
jgi:hypothetical protein